MTAHAIIIAINDYPPEADQEPLYGAVADALEFAEWACSPAGGDVQPADCFFWTYPAPPALPASLAMLAGAGRPWPNVPRPDFTLSPDSIAIKRAVRVAAEQAVTANADRLYIFFAGHGATVTQLGFGTDPQNCLLAGNFLPNDSEGLVPLDDLRRMLVHVGPREVLLIHDSCRSHLPLPYTMPVLGAPAWQAAGVNQGWMVGRAARPGQLSYEVPPKVPEARGAFTKMLIQALRQYRVGAHLNMPQLNAFLRHGVEMLVKPKIQEPVLIGPEDQQNFIVLSTARTGAQSTIRVTPSQQAGSILIRDGAANVVHGPIAVNGAPIEADFWPGQYIVEHDPSGDSVAVFHLGPEATHVQF